MTYGLPDSMLVGMSKRVAKAGTRKQRNIDTTLPLTTRAIEGVFGALWRWAVTKPQEQERKRKLQERKRKGVRFQ